MGWCIVCRKAFVHSSQAPRCCSADCSAYWKDVKAVSAALDYRRHRVALLRRDGFHCALCGERFDLTIAYPDDRCVSVDHVVPKARGGSDAISNLQLAHMACNQRKATMSMDEWRAVESTA